MKYHGYIIKKVKADLGESNDRYNRIYEIYKDNKLITTALELSQAKNLIDSNFDKAYLV